MCTLGLIKLLAGISMEEQSCQMEHTLPEVHLKKDWFKVQTELSHGLLSVRN